ncbi:MAG TPA: diaminopimelate epimerase [Clostridiales bacterium]|nr:diaminopimelate epimerase [Clostridiales bacterium]
MKFTKMHGAGNDYIYVNCFEEQITDPPEVARIVSDRHFGIGGDGLICILPSSVADFKMEIYNADGSRAEMCGNGIRCVGKYVYDRGLTDKTVINVETGAGIKTLWLNLENGFVKTVRVCMGRPEFRPALIPVDDEGEDFILRPVFVDGTEYLVTALSVGNPHAVIFVNDVDSLELASLGPKFENHRLFPERINTEFVQIIDRKTLKMRVWERGSGQTLACGTGATASLAAAVACGFTDPAAKLILAGGELYIEWDREENLLYMTGPAEFVFDGQINL